MSSSLVKLLGSQFKRYDLEAEEKEGNSVELTRNKLSVIGLYFANMQSTKSKEFTKVLQEFYDQKKTSAVPASSASTFSMETQGNSDLSTFEVIIIHYDEMEKIVHLSSTSTQFLHFEGDGARVRQEYLIRKFSVHETPTLILMDGDSGRVINFHAKEKMIQDPMGFHFPWRHSSFTVILDNCQMITSSSASNNTVDTHSQSVLKDSIRGLFFAAHWYPQCRTFMTNLIDVYNKIRERGNKFEIIFISSDRSKESFDRFFSKMPWFGIRYEEDAGVRDELTALLNVKSIPTLVIMDSEDNVITPDGRLEVNDDIDGFDFPWYPKLVEELRDRHSAVLNSSLSLIYFIGDDDAEYDKAEGTLLPIATQITTDESEVEEAFLPKFFIGTDSELSESLRLFIDLEEIKSFILILDIPNFRYAVLLQDIGDENSVKEFLHKFRTSKMQYKYIQSRFI